MLHPLSTVFQTRHTTSTNDHGIQYIVLCDTDRLPLLIPHAQPLMIAISCAILAVPLVAVAVAASSPVADLAALLAHFQSQGSGLHARQNFQYPAACSPLCGGIWATLSVSNPSLSPKHGSRRCHTLNYHSGIRRIAPVQRAPARLRTRMRSSVAWIALSRRYRRPRTFKMPSWR